MQTPRGAQRVIRFTTESVGTATWIRLPAEARWWTWASSSGAALSLKWGDQVLPSVEVFPAAGYSGPRPNAGDDLYLGFLAPLGTIILISWVM